MMKLTNDTQWSELLYNELKNRSFLEIEAFLANEELSHTVLPDNEHIFYAFDMTPFDKIKVVILGQDPYHGEGQAHGLAFSVQDGVSFPPSLRNIFQEYQSDLGFNIPASGNLTTWAKEGVFLLNTVLTVREKEPNSHKKIGWEKFTDEVIKLISKNRENIVFILWGKPAQSKVKLIDESKHLILTSPHPSPLSSYRGFFGSKPFSKTNTYLNECGIDEIDWKLD